MGEHKIPEEEFENYKQIFSLFDRDGDGRVDVVEFGTVLRAVGRMPSEADLKDLKANLPASAKEQFSFADLLTAIVKLPPVDAVALRHALTDAFRVFDQSGSGQIGAAELRHIMTSLGEKLSEEEASEMIKLADPANSGTVHYANFIDKLVAQ